MRVSYSISPTARLVAFYLPQFYPIPENDEWWGKGFTEWRNVAKAKPLYRGHYQPHIPADLGFYDLRVPETRAAQAEMAQSYGIEGFCYWHYYWFAGRRLLERPLDEVLLSGEPRFPFCLAWANLSWGRNWSDRPDSILVQQTYPGLIDYEEHFRSVLPALSDERYIKVDGKPVFIVWAPDLLPDAHLFTDCWRRLALASGLPGLHLVGNGSPSWNPSEHGFDASVLGNPPTGIRRAAHARAYRSHKELVLKLYGLYRELASKPIIHSYKRVIQLGFPPVSEQWQQYPRVIPNWDNTPRRGVHGTVYHGSTPELFAVHLKDTIKQVADRPPQNRLVFVQAWNEWAEGNHLEPDERFGRRYLEVVRDTIHVPLS